MIITTTIKNIKDYDDPWFDKAFEGLPQWRKEKAAKIREKNSKKTSILAGHLLKEAFEGFGVDPENVIFNEYGKPSVAGEDPPFFFSLSHSKDAVALSLSNPNDNTDELPGEDRIDVKEVFAAAAVSPRSDVRPSNGVSVPSIGVDIEQIRDFDERITKRFFTEEEKDFLLFSADKNEAFTRIWTSKEAYGKFTGRGLTDALKFSIFHNPVMPLNVILPCCFEHGRDSFNGDRYVYTLCYGVIEEEINES